MEYSHLRHSYKDSEPKARKRFFRKFSEHFHYGRVDEWKIIKPGKTLIFNIFVNLIIWRYNLFVNADNKFLIFFEISYLLFEVFLITTSFPLGR